MANEKLPEDLVMEILCRLPVKYLLQFKSVCKNWYSLIQNPSFISLHHNRATSIAAARNTDCLLVKRYVDGGNGKIILSLVPNETPAEDIDISSTGLDIGRLQLLGPCNGVVCLTSHGYNSTIVICNPSIREFRVLPKPSYIKDSLTTLGFGFDLNTNDYKVVKFGYMKHPFIPSDNNETIEIYEMSKNSWRIVDAESPISFGFLFCVSTSTYWNGGCYWVVFCPGGGWAIFVFRMSCDEVFDKIPVPELCLLNKSCRKELLVVNDTLALVLYPLAGDFLLEKCFDIWVMDAQSVEVSWTKKFTIGPLQKPNVPLGFRKNGEFLLQSRGGQMMSYHIDTRQIKEYQICGYRPPRCLQVLLYSESLVSVKRHNQRDRPNDLDGSSVVDFSTLS